MSGFEELKTAYEHINKECGFAILDLIVNDEGDEKRYELVFKYFGVGIRMTFSYGFIVASDPSFDDVLFTGDPCSHFSIYCFRGIVNFIETLQKNRSDTDSMAEFISYLEKEKMRND